MDEIKTKEKEARPCAQQHEEMDEIKTKEKEARPCAQQHEEMDELLDLERRSAQELPRKEKGKKKTNEMLEVGFSSGFSSPEGHQRH